MRLPKEAGTSKPVRTLGITISPIEASRFVNVYSVQLLCGSRASGLRVGSAAETVTRFFTMKILVIGSGGRALSGGAQFASSHGDDLTCGEVVEVPWIRRVVARTIRIREVVEHCIQAEIVEIRKRKAWTSVKEMVRHKV